MVFCTQADPSIFEVKFPNSDIKGKVLGDNLELGVTNIILHSEKDTTIYQKSGSLNLGLDEVLEIQKTVSDSGDSVNVSRILIKFDLVEISSSIVDGTITNPSYYLNLLTLNLVT